MAYESNDMRPVRDVREKGREPDPPRLRADDADIRPLRPPPAFVAIARPPDHRAGEKPGGGAAARPDAAREALSAASLLTKVAWGLGGALALGLYFQLAGLFARVLEYHGWRLWVALALFAVPVAALLYVTARCWRVFRRLRTREQIVCDLRTRDMTAEDVSRLIRLRFRGMDREDYPLAFRPEHRAEVASLIRRLPGYEARNVYSDATGWVDDFARLQSLQETCALDAVKTYCKLIALKTAACPWKALDMVIVFANLTLMVAAIARVYDCGISRGGAFRLLCRWFVNIYISGELGAISEKAAAGASGGLADWLAGRDAAPAQVVEAAAGDVSAEGAADSLAGVLSASLPLLSQFAGKAAEGAINAYFAYRMGLRAMDEFRWVAPPAAD